MCPGEAERAKVAPGGRTATPHSALAWKPAARSTGPGQGLQALGSQEEPGRTSCLHVQIPTGVCWLCALHLPATGMTLSFRCPLHQGPSASPEGDQREAGCVFGRMVTNAAGLLPACPRDGSDGSWASLPLHCPPLPCSSLHASFSQLLLSLSVHSRTRESGVEGPRETWNCGANSHGWDAGSKGRNKAKPA